MIFVGDFFQLPPVSKDSAGAAFAFESRAWRETKPEVVELTEVFRQADPAHVSLLHRVRVGQAAGAGLSQLQIAHAVNQDPFHVAFMLLHDYIFFSIFISPTSPSSSSPP